MSLSPAPAANPLPVATGGAFEEAQIQQIIKYCKDYPDIVTAKITYIGDGEDDGHTVTVRVVVSKLTSKLITCVAQPFPNGPVSTESLTFGPGRRILLDFRPTSEPNVGHKTEASELQRTIASMITGLSESQARQDAHSRAVADVVLAQMAMTKAMEERDNRRDVSVSSHDEVLRNSCIDRDTRRGFMKLQMLPLEFPKRVLGATTPEFISIYDAVVTLAIKMMSWTASDSYKRTELSKKLKGLPEAFPWLFLWLLRGKLEADIAFLLALEIVIIDQKLGKAIRHKMIVSALAVAHPTEHTETWAEKNEVKSLKKEVEGLFLSFYACAAVAQGAVPAPPSSFSKKGTWQTGGAPQNATPPTTTGRPQDLTRKKGKAGATRHVSGGGGPLLVPDPVDEEEPTGTGVPPAFAAFQAKHRGADAKPLPAAAKPLQVAAKPVEKTAMPVEKRTAGSAAPFLKDMLPGALVTDWILDVVIRGIVRITGNKVAVIFPGTLQRWLALNRKKDFEKVTGSRAFLAPLIIKDDHWVLVAGSPTELVIFDSLPSHSGHDALHIAEQMAAFSPSYAKTSIRREKWLTQAPGSNDCAMFCMKAAWMVASGRTQAQVRDTFSRAFVDHVVPHVPQGQQSFHAIALDRQLRAGLNLPATSARPACHTCSRAIERDSAHLECSDCLQLWHASCVDMEHASTVAGEWRCPGCTKRRIIPKPLTCSWESCGKVIKPGCGSACTACKTLFCTSHADYRRRKAGTWKCVTCAKKDKPASVTATLGDDFSKGTAIAKDPPDRPKESAQGQDFCMGQGSPRLTPTAGAICQQLRGPTLRKSMHPLADMGISAESRKEHLRVLQLLARAPPETATWPMAQVCLEVLEKERQRQRWRWTTMENKSGQLAGALRRLPQYTDGSLPAIFLVTDEEWRDAGKNIRARARRNAATGLPAVTAQDIMKAIEQAPTEAIKVALIITWACCARAGDVTQLKMWNIELRMRSDGLVDMIVFFERGKVIGKIDPYHVHTAIPADAAATLQRYLGRNHASKFLFPCPSRGARAAFLRSIRNHLRLFNKEYDTRALRRGAVQALAEKGVPLATILTFTKHADLGMLRRYLRYGKTLSEEARKGCEAASRLWSTHS